MTISVSQALEELKKVKRTGWLRLGISPCETVADHTLFAACLAIIFCDICDIPHNDILPTVILHDIAEAITGDIPNDLNPSFPNKMKYEQDAASSMINDDMSKHKEALISYYKKENPHSSFIKNMDALSTLLQTLMYEYTGWRGLNHFWHAYSFGNSIFFNQIYNDLLSYRTSVILNNSNELSITNYYESYCYSQFEENLLEEKFTQNIYGHIFDDFFKSTNLDIRKRKILDIGAGTGRFSEWFRKDDSSIYSLDINWRLLSKVPQSENLHSIKWDITTSWPFSNESQDLVLCGEVLEHLFRPDFVLAEAYRVLDKDGYIIISAPDSNHESRKSNILRYGYPESPENRKIFEEHIQIFTPFILKKGLERCGFVPISMCWYNLQTGEHTPFFNPDNIDENSKSLMRHIFIVAKKAPDNKPTSSNISLSCLVELAKIINRAKFCQYHQDSNQTIAEHYFTELCKALLTEYSSMQYRIFLLNFLRDCYLVGIKEEVKKDLLMPAVITQTLQCLSKETGAFYGNFPKEE